MTEPLSADRTRANQAEIRAFWLACQFAWLTLFVFWVIASTSIDTEFARDGRAGPPFFSWVTEGSSVIMTALMAPAMMWLGLRAPLEPGRWMSSLPWHIAGFLGYTSLHVLGMVLIREGVWAFGYGGDYEFFHDSPWREIVYEARKDIGTYAGYQIIMAVSLALQMRQLEVDVARAEARQSHRLTLKCGGRTLRIAADEFRAAQAAGNYVEIGLASGRPESMRSGCIGPGWSTGVPFARLRQPAKVTSRSRSIPGHRYPAVAATGPGWTPTERAGRNGSDLP